MVVKKQEIFCDLIVYLLFNYFGVVGMAVGEVFNSDSIPSLSKPSSGPDQSLPGRIWPPGLMFESSVFGQQFDWLFFFFFPQSNLSLTFKTQRCQETKCSVQDFSNHDTTSVATSILLYKVWKSNPNQVIKYFKLPIMVLNKPTGQTKLNNASVSSHIIQH